MKYNLPQKVEKDIIKIAKKYDLESVVLFGSRARRDNGERSDIDLAVRGGDSIAFAVSIQEEAETLLMFDVVELDKPIKRELLNEIEREGIVIYEKI